MLRFILLTLKKVTPKPLKKLYGSVRAAWFDLKEDIRRHFPPTHEGYPAYGLRGTQIYPEGKNFDTQLQNGLLSKGKRLNINQKTKLASLGSCFAEEFAYYMQEHKYNYLKYTDEKVKSSCDWRRVYTIPNFSQIAQYSTRTDYPLFIEKCSTGWFDPLREFKRHLYSSPEGAKEGILKHRELSQKTFRDTDVLVFTLGQNEFWYDNKLNIAWAERPLQEHFEQNPGRFHVKENRFDENVAMLSGTIKQIIAFNPSASIILTVSPVPAYATFVSDDVVTQSFANKCILRAVAQEMINLFPNKVTYFPSFEVTLAYNPYSLKSDNRHVKFNAVRRIFRTFETTFTEKTI